MILLREFEIKSNHGKTLALSENHDLLEYVIRISQKI